VYHDGRGARAVAVDEGTGVVDEGTGCSSGGSTRSDDRPDLIGDAGAEAGGDGAQPPGVGSASVCAGTAQLAASPFRLGNDDAHFAKFVGLGFCFAIDVSVPVLTTAGRQASLGTGVQTVQELGTGVLQDAG